MRASACVLALFSVAAAAESFRFQVVLDPAVAASPMEGRLFVLLEPGTASTDRVQLDFLPGRVRVIAREVKDWKPGETVEMTARDAAYPDPLPSIPAGNYRVMALLDPDHSFARDRQDAGDLCSAVEIVRGMKPAEEGVVTLRLSKITPPPNPMAESPTLRIVERKSDLLSQFWGRPIRMRAGIVLPRDADKGEPLPAVYHVHGFGGNHREAWLRENSLVDAMASGDRFRAAHVFLDGSFTSGHHGFADSVNNGPWATALVNEFIPYLEETFPLVRASRGRFLTGHSSGGWSTLWLQINYPSYFGGAWPTAPDAIDFRSFSGIDASADSKGNAYLDAKGRPLNLVRMEGKDVMSVREFAALEAVTGEYGGQLSSFEWVFSPRGPDGRPVEMFNRHTGALNPVALAHWAKYDIARLLRERWEELGPKLNGRIHLTVGSEDNFHLEASAKLFCGFLESKGYRRPCEIVPGRDHMNLFRDYKTYPRGLEQRIDDEMRAAWTQAR